MDNLKIVEVARIRVYKVFGNHKNPNHEESKDMLEIDW